MTLQDDVRPLYRTVVTLGVVAVVILAAGLVDFFAFEPPGQNSGTQASVKGVFHYDPNTHQVSGSDSHHFTADESFAAVVDWTSLPSSLTVGARWYNTLGSAVGGVGPEPAGQLSDHSVVAVQIPEGFKHNVPGDYEFVVERYREGQPVEVLARRLVYVKSAA